MHWGLAILVCGASVMTACSSSDDNPATQGDGHAKKALLVILDGWGIGDKGRGDVIYQTATPYIDYLYANYPHSELQASGECVGLPDRQMGNSETGHLNIGAGRVVYQDLVRINCTRSVRHIVSATPRTPWNSFCPFRMAQRRSGIFFQIFLGKFWIFEIFFINFATEFRSRWPTSARIFRCWAIRF